MVKLLRSNRFIIIGILLSISLKDSEAFLGVNSNKNKQYTHTPFVRNKSTQIATASFDDFEEYSNDISSSSSSSSSSDEDIFASLRARQDYLSSYGNMASITSNNNGNADSQKKGSKEDSKMMYNWRNANCKSTVRLSADDWIRRVAIDTYPLGVCGSCNGNIYLCDLGMGKVLDCIPDIHEAHIDDEDVEDAMRKLFGKHDGGGTLALAIKNDIVVSAGREGGLQVFKIDGEEKSLYKGSRGGSAKSTVLHLKSEGMLFYLVSSLVTSLAFDDSGFLWVGSFDGYVRGFEYDDKEKPLVEQTVPSFDIDIGSEVLNLSVNNELGCGVASTAGGDVVLFSLEEGEIITKWKPFGKGAGKRKREYARSAIIVQNDEATDSNEAVWSIIAGGSVGSMFQIRLNVDSMGYVSETSPLVHDESLIGRFRPSHNMAIMSLSSPFPGLIASASQDGQIRVWDCSYHRTDDETIVTDDEDDEDEAQFDDIGGLDRRPQSLYALMGYKVWLGSIFSNGKRLVSDGADNAIVVHDFSGEDSTVKDLLLEDDDDDDLEDYSNFD